MNVAWYLMWFIVAVSLLVTVHEFGHFWVARRLGFKVLRFSVGFGKPLFERQGADGTVYAVAMLPLGGYVKLLDEREGPVPPAELSRSFTRKPPWQRILVLLAGPAFNIVFAILVLWGMFMSKGTIEEPRPVIGDVVAASVAGRGGLHSDDLVRTVDGAEMTTRRDVLFALLDSLTANGRASMTVTGKDGQTRPVALEVGDSAARRKLTEPAALFTGLGFEFWEPTVPAVVGRLSPGEPAEKAGLRKGDRIIAMNDQPTNDFTGIYKVTSASHPGDELTIRYVRGTEERTVRVKLGGQKGPSGKEIGYLGVGPVEVKLPESMIVRTQLTVGSAFAAANTEAWNLTMLQVRLVSRMLTGNVSLKNLSGPLSIAEFAGESASDGAMSFMNFLVLISLSLGFLNLLPIPILDGGQVVFQLVEWLKGSPLSERAQVFGQQIGIALLILMMGVALFNDVARQIGPALSGQ
ncbi:MAG: RIP metalloprotease RseP [Gammaproteobacteria bacterium]